MGASETQYDYLFDAGRLPFDRFFRLKKEMACFPSCGAKAHKKKQSEPALQKRAKYGKAKRKMKWSEWKHLLGVIYRQIKKAIIVKRLHIDWDTDDFSLNAWLYPVFHRLNGHNRQLSINFIGTPTCGTPPYTRLGLLAAAGLKVYISSKNAPNGPFQKNYEEVLAKVTDFLKSEAEYRNRDR